MENSPTVILSLGEERKLNFFRRYASVSSSGLLKWKDDEDFRESIEMKHGNVKTSKFNNGQA